MAVGNGVTKEEFKTSFTEVEPLIVQEWPQVDRDSLGGTDGDFEKVVDLVAKKTEHTKALVRRQLAELSRVAAEDSAEGRIKRMLQRLEDKTTELREFVSSNMLPTAEEKVRNHLVVSMVVTSAFGFLLGFIFRGFGRGR